MKLYKIILLSFAMGMAGNYQYLKDVAEILDINYKI